MKHSVFNEAIILLLLIFSTSCINNQTEDGIKNMIDKKVDLSGLVQVKSKDCNDTSLITDANLSAKLVMYLDTASCSSCVINKIGQYDSFYKKSKESKGKFILIFVMSVPQKEFSTIKNYIISKNFEYPIYFDNENKFRKKNDFIPDNSRFHSFLLDESNRITLVGNPIVSDSMWELYTKTIDDLIVKK